MWQNQEKRTDDHKSRSTGDSLLTGGSDTPSFITHATRWIVIGIIAISAIGGFPGIAAACEGGGEEEIEVKFNEEEKTKPTTGTFSNPHNLAVEIVGILKPGTGPILGGTCKVGKRVSSLGTCTVIQDEPLGAFVDVVLR